MESLKLLTSTILIVDDQESNIVFLKQLLKRKGYQNIISLMDSREVMSYVQRHQPDLILLDLTMPYMDGFQILAALKETLPESNFLPVVVLTADSLRETRLRALEAGAIDFLTKPLDAVEVLNRVHNFLYSRFLHKQQMQHNIVLKHMVDARTRELVSTNFELEKANQLLQKVYGDMLEKLSLAAEYRDDDTGEHTRRVAQLSYLTAVEMGFLQEDAELILQAARLHDIGKIGIPDNILLKPGKLNDSEMRVMKKHCEIGASLLRGGDSKLLLMAESIALTHHERWDGLGYPSGLREKQIPIEGRIVALADLYDALMHHRGYRPAWPKEQVVKLINEERGKSFDPTVVDVFLQVIADLPRSKQITVSASKVNGKEVSMKSL